MNARVPLSGPFEQHPDVQAVFQYYRDHGFEPINILRAFANAPQVFPALNGFLNGLRSSLTLDPADHELIVLRTAHSAKGDYEIVHHNIAGRMAGLTDAQIAGTADWRDCDAFTPRQRALLAFVDAAMAPEPVGDAVYAAAQREFDSRQLLEAVLLSGAYTMIAMVARTFEIPHDLPRSEETLYAFFESEKP